MAAQSDRDKIALGPLAAFRFISESGYEENNSIGAISSALCQ